jgi:guanidinopropionase
MTEKEAPAALRFMGIATFMMQPFQADPEGLDIAIAGVPYDGGVTNRPGARHGPREIRNASSMTRQIHPVTGTDPYALARAAPRAVQRCSDFFICEDVLEAESAVP